MKLIELSLDILSEWWFFNANSAIFQLYHAENKLIFNEMMRFSLYKINYKIGIVASSLSTQHEGERAKTDWLEESESG
jgi:hypothetical protein